MNKLNIFQKVVRSLFFLTCLSLTLWQCHQSFNRLLEKPIATSVGIDFAKNWPMPKINFCPIMDATFLQKCCIGTEGYYVYDDEADDEDYDDEDYYKERCVDDYDIYK